MYSFYVSHAETSKISDPNRSLQMCQPSWTETVTADCSDARHGTGHVSNEEKEKIIRDRVNTMIKGTTKSGYQAMFKHFSNW